MREIAKYTRRGFLSRGGGLVGPRMHPSAGFICQRQRSLERDEQRDRQAGRDETREKSRHRQQEKRGEVTQKRKTQ